MWTKSGRLIVYGISVSDKVFRTVQLIYFSILEELTLYGTCEREHCVETETQDWLCTKVIVDARESFCFSSYYHYCELHVDLSCD